MLAHAERQAFSGIVCYRSDRLFRSIHHLVNTIDMLNRRGIGFNSATELFDSTTATFAAYPDGQ
jgi:DNA invertase Pin-like site-specific DNA recombinase